MAQLRHDYQRFVAQNIAIVVIGPERADAFRAYWAQHELPFIGLPDPDHTVLKRYGQEVRLLKLGRMPAQMLIDTAGMLRFVHYNHSMADIPPNDEILQVVA